MKCAGLREQNCKHSTEGRTGDKVTTTDKSLHISYTCVRCWRFSFQNIQLWVGLIKPKITIMSDFKTRLVEEQAQLQEKLTKLNDFNASEKANEIDPVQKSLLLVQAGAMYTYNEVLKARIERL